ncbi:MAG: hypothetical protein H7067_12720, partial [Burkholderiales bacterium]|nr:hypothetical protein [Opitutaceae bacterium]
MKSSIGSLAALAAFATPLLAAPLPPPVAADFNHVPVSLSDPTPINFDIDGDNTDDFYVYGNSGIGFRVAMYGATKFSSPLTSGTFFAPTSASFTSNTVIFANETALLGFSFVTGSQTHAAWVLFDANASAPQVIGGGWQTIANQSVLVGSPTPAAVPEPSSFALLAGAAALTG